MRDFNGRLHLARYLRAIVKPPNANYQGLSKARAPRLVSEFCLRRTFHAVRPRTGRRIVSPA